MLSAPEAQDPRTVALCTSVVHPDGTVDVLHRCDYGTVITPMRTPYRGHPTVDCASFVGLLVRAGAARAAGLPRAEFFLGYDDAEWSLRLRRDGGEIRLVPEAEMLHKIPVGGTTPTARSRFWNRVLRQSYESSPWPSYWKDLYRVRNVVWLRTAHDHIGTTQYLLLLGAYVVKTVLYDDKPLRRLPWLVRFAVRGRRADFRAPSPAEWAARAGG
jgi:GT2 family glycosyltransferase